MTTLVHFHQQGKISLNVHYFTTISVECQRRMYLENVVMKSVPYRLYLCLNVGRCNSVSTITKLRISSVISRVLNNRSLFLLKIWQFWGFSSCTCIIGVLIIVRCPQGQCLCWQKCCYNFLSGSMLYWNGSCH